MLIFPFHFSLHLLSKLSLIQLAEMRIGECLDLDGSYLAVSLGHDVVKSSHPTIDKKEVKNDETEY